MLCENIKTIRKAKGFSQEELASRLNVVRQTVSKWEKGLSVPDAELLVALSEVLETPVGTLLGETVSEPEAGDLQVISRRLEEINLLLAGQKRARRRTVFWLLISLCILILLIAVVLCALGSPYLGWNYDDPEKAVLGVAFHSFEWVFFRTAPIVLAGAVVGIVLTRK
ncbi:MAG: helix-turn-helix transcriptional regulator [Clostridia bacterium]|nr:helix-turn-helix transcriptional regulator [Clostridia bacterium]